MRASPLRALLGWGLAGILTGCAGYHLGPTSGVIARERSIQVNPFQNSTMEPRLIEYVTSALRRNLQQEGTYRLDTHGNGDIVVSGVITQYERSGVSYQPGDVITARDYGLSLVAKVTAIERSTGRVLLDREVGGRTTVRVGNDLSSVERQAAPLLADDLARNVTSFLVDGDW
jgi:Lipopolysaccharide-assembly